MTTTMQTTTDAHLITIERATRIWRTIWIRFVALTLLTGLPLAVSATPGCRILVHGDSLSAAYGLKREAGWVTLLQTRLQSQGASCDVINASISGETTAGGLARLPALLQKHTPTHLVLELGANDGLRGLDTQAMQNNLQQMVDLSAKAGARVLLVGVRIPPNYGKAYQERFEGAFVQVAKRNRLPRVTSLLEGIETDRSAFQADGLHPTAEVQPRLLDNVWPQLKPLL